ncbi:MAG: DEAD/DEAH box helicase, partial [Methylotenera sp.]
LDMGFMPDLKRILALLPKQRQNLMFSATFSNEIKKLADDFLTKPQLIEVARSNATNDNVTQKVYQVAQSDKEALLIQQLKATDSKQVLIFTKTKLTASRLSRSLEREGIAADAIHGDKTQQERMKALDAFKSGTVAVLVATDVAARGLDIDQLPMVINYEIPSAPEDYVHRIGRTGRAGASGIAISFVSPEEDKYMVEIEKLIKRQITKEIIEIEKPSPRSRPGANKPSQSRTSNVAANQDASATKRMPAKKKSIDPWFDKPYEAVITQKDTSVRSTPTNKAPIAALLGGLRHNK